MIASAPAVLEQLLALTGAMLAAAGNEDWDRVMALEAEREPLARRPLAGEPDAQRRLGELLEYDRQLRTLVAAARDRAGAQWRLESGRAQAIAAYGG